LTSRSDSTPRLALVAESIHDLWRDESRAFARREDRYAVALARRFISGRQRTARQLGKDSPSGSASPGGKLLGGLQNVFVYVQSGSHESDHHASLIRRQRLSPRCLSLKNGSDKNSGPRRFIGR